MPISAKKPWYATDVHGTKGRWARCKCALLSEEQVPFVRGHDYTNPWAQSKLIPRWGSSMRRRDRPAERRASTNSVDPLEKALRQMGADMLDEPVPERLLRVLRQARGDAEAEPDARNWRSQGTDRRR
jgi:hypothetical protein